MWLLDVRDFSSEQRADALRSMSDSEITRAEKFKRGKEEFIASRWLLRKVLAGYTGVTADTVAFLRSDKGKPYLPHSDIQFSLSHSGHWALLAVGNANLIGVDIEGVRATRDLLAIAESYYHPHEFAQLQTLEGAAQADYFYRLWTLKEAFFKALGTGISAGLEKVHFSLEGDQIAAAIDPTLDGDNHTWQFHQWLLTADVYCALAYTGTAPVRVKWFNPFSAPAFP